MYITQDTFDQWLRELDYIIGTKEKEDAALEILKYLETQGAFEVVTD